MPALLKLFHMTRHQLSFHFTLRHYILYIINGRLRIIYSCIKSCLIKYIKNVEKRLEK